MQEQAQQGPDPRQPRVEAEMKRLEVEAALKQQEPELWRYETDVNAALTLRELEERRRGCRVLGPPPEAKEKESAGCAASHRLAVDSFPFGESNMVYPISKPANATVHSAVLDYLNLNRHKFDQHGNFDPTPSEEDHMPWVLARYSVKPPKLPPSLANILRQVKKRQTEIEQFHKDRRDTANEGHKYDTDDCNDYYYNHMEYRCKRDFKDNPYVPGEYYKCIARAKALRDYCLRHHVFPEGLMEWGEADMDIVKDKDKSKKRNDPNREQEPEPDPQGNPYIFGPPQGAPAIYRAPLMPPELQRKIPRGTVMTPEERELALQLAQSLALSFLFRRPMGPMGARLGSGARIPNGLPVPAPR